MFVVALHVLLCLFLILIILLQPGKGGDVGAAFGGGSSGSMFGPRGPANLLQRATTIVAVMFMGTSITLAYYSSQKMLSNANVDDELLRLQQEQIERVQEEKELPAEDVEEPAE
jgi:preprotein translocase subunit SecG